VLSPFYDEAGITLYLGDARVIAPMLATELPLWGEGPATGRVHVLCDSPYTPHTHDKSRAGARGGPKGAPLHNGTGLVSKASISRSVDFGFAPLSSALRHTLADEAARLTTAWSLFFTDAEGVDDWRRALAEAQLENVRVGAWLKLGSTPQFTGDRPGVGFEAIVIAHATAHGKPLKKSWNGGGKVAIWEHQIVTEHGGRDLGEARVHETQKPEALITALLEDFTDPGDMVIDFTAGSGTTLVCARRLGRRAVGIEQREKDCENAVRRLRGELAGTGYTPAMKRGQQGLFNQETGS